VDQVDALLHSLALVQAELVFLEHQIANLRRRAEIVRAHEGDILERLSLVQELNLRPDNGADGTNHGS
jgi:hypothetical protein